LEEVGMGEAGRWAVDFWRERPDPDASNKEPANSSTNIAPRATPKLRAELLPKLLPNLRPFPITLFLRCNQIALNQLVLERVETARESVLHPAPAKPPAADVTFRAGGKQTTT
jgi:hypothetical protein